MPDRSGAKADAPLETDQPGYEVTLLDSYSEETLVMGHVRVPESFGKVDFAELVIRDAENHKVGEMLLAPEIPPMKTPGVEFFLRREYLKNSTVTVAHDDKDNTDMAVFCLGTFGVRDLQSKNGPLPLPHDSASSWQSRECSTSNTLNSRSRTRCR